MFISCNNFNADITGWDVSSGTTWTEAFQDCTIFNQDVGSWDMADVAYTYRMFKQAKAFNQNVGSWNMSSVVMMREMFSYAWDFNNGGSSTINNWNVTASTDFRQMFFYSDFNQPIGSWTINTSASVGMYQMLRLTPFNQDISDWDISLVNNLTGFFEQNTALSTANYNLLLHHWEAEDPVDSLNFHGGDATTDTTSGSVDGTAARARLVLATGSGGDGWTITDGD